MQKTDRNSSRTAATLAVINSFNDMLNQHDVDGVMALMTEECVFENTYPAPDGQRYVGQAAVRGFWEDMLRSTPTARFETEEIIASGDRCTVRWRYHYTDAHGAAGHIRGVDVFRVYEGRVTEKFAYVKG